MKVYVFLIEIATASTGFGNSLIHNYIHYNRVFQRSRKAIVSSSKEEGDFHVGSVSSCTSDYTRRQQHDPEISKTKNGVSRVAYCHTEEILALSTKEADSV